MLLDAQRYGEGEVLCAGLNVVSAEAVNCHCVTGYRTLVFCCLDPHHHSLSTKNVCVGNQHQIGCCTSCS